MPKKLHFKSFLKAKGKGACLISLRISTEKALSQMLIHLISRGSGTQKKLSVEDLKGQAVSRGSRQSFKYSVLLQFRTLTVKDEYRTLNWAQKEMNRWFRCLSTGAMCSLSTKPVQPMCLQWALHLGQGTQHCPQLGCKAAAVNVHHERKGPAH